MPKPINAQGRPEMKSRWHLLASHLGRVFLHALAAALVLWVLVLIPLPVFIPQVVAAVRVPLAVLFLVIYLGKLLYDTLFYDHYQP
jgi:putative exporter of polyketide antibiotics